jgi:hypothetical protein
MARDYSGMRFNKLTLLTRIGDGGPGKGALWLAECQCGRTRELVGKDVARGKIRSCGKCRGELDKPAERPRPRTAAERRSYYLAARKAVREGSKWALTYSEFKEIADRGCLICREAPLVPLMWDPVGGYSPGNVTLLCRICNRHRGNSNLRDFLEYIEFAHANLVRITNNT